MVTEVGHQTATDRLAGWHGVWMFTPDFGRMFCLTPIRHFTSTREMFRTEFVVTWRETTVRDLVWRWLSERGRSRRTFYLSDVTKGLCGPSRRIRHLTEDPRSAIREALVELEAEGCLSLSPTKFNGRGGRGGIQIELSPKDTSTQGEADE